MEISINEQNQQWLEQKVASGEFATADDVLEKARELFAQHDEYLTDLRAKVQEGLESLENGDYTEYADETLHKLFDRVKRRGRDMLAAENADLNDN